jgi:glycosyltransferase involved in cell wall biosynthesis
VGSRGWLYEDFFRKLDELGMADMVHFPGYVPAGDLPLLYNAASVAILPSVYEGFGLPLLEAMACGAPIVSSNTSSLTEIGGDAAHYFDPYDLEAMVNAIRSVWRDTALQAEMRRRGLRQADRFSWDRAAAETCAVYEALLD